jgi:hypothetical protein
MDVLHAVSVEAFRRSFFDKFHDQVIDAVHAFETAESVGAVWDDDVKTVRQCLRSTFTIRGRRHRIPLTRQDQNRHI